MQLLWPLVTTRQAGGYLDLEGGNRICMVYEWTLGLKRLAYSRIDLSLCCSISQGNMPQNHQTFCVSLVLVSFTLIYRAACPFLVKHSTIITSDEESLRDSKLPVTGCLRTKRQCMKLVLVSFTLFYSTSYMCISIVSHFTVMFARGTCAS